MADVFPLYTGNLVWDKAVETAGEEQEGNNRKPRGELPRVLALYHRAG